MAAKNQDVRVREVMARDVVIVHPDDPLSEAVSLMFENRVSAVPVVDKRQRCKGILSTTDLINLFRKQSAGPVEPDELDQFTEDLADANQRGSRLVRRKVAEVMTADVMTVTLEKEPTHEIGTLAGTVMNEEGEFIAGAHVMAAHTRLDIAYEAVTNDHGRFEIDDMITGEYNVFVEAEGYREWQGETHIESGEMTGMEILLEREPTHETGALVGTVLNENNDYVNGAHVLAIHTQYDITYTAVTTYYGRFEIDDMVAGEYLVYVEAEGYRESRSETHVEPGEVTTIRIMLEYV